MNTLMQAIETVYGMQKGQTIAFVSGATVEMVKRNSYRVTDKHGKEYTSLNRDHAAMIAHKGE